MSEPQIVSMDVGGVHNRDIEATSARLYEGGSWKKTRVVVLVPSPVMIPAKVALSHWNLITPPNQPVHRMLCLGCEVGKAYSHAIEAVLANPQLSEWEYVLTLEADNMPPSDGLIRLIEDMEKYPQYHCIGGLYFCKGPGGCAHLWGSPDLDPVVNYRPQVPRPGQVMEVYGGSMGFNLWRLSMFKDKRLPRPLFETKCGPGGVGTQDLAFWGAARPLGYRCAVDCRIAVGHHDQEGKFGPPDTTW